MAALVRGRVYRPSPAPRPQHALSLLHSINHRPLPRPVHATPKCFLWESCAPVWTLRPHTDTQGMAVWSWRQGLDVAPSRHGADLAWCSLAELAGMSSELGALSKVYLLFHRLG